MQKIAVRQGNAAYDVTVCPGGLARVREVFDLDRRVLIVTDDGVPQALSAAVASACGAAEIYRFPKGEKSKNLHTYGGILSAALAAGLTRGDAIVAVGGGVTGDLAGFAAATYLRGIDFYNVPTTLLSQVDSSVGGKTGVDFEGVKNAVGAFYPPRGVLIDPAVLFTLPLREFRAGLAEIVKIAATCDAELFEMLEKTEFPWGKSAGGESPLTATPLTATPLTADPLAGNPLAGNPLAANPPSDAPVGEALPAGFSAILARAVENKRNVVEKDPLEKGLRRVLNFGHTLGHAVESAAHGALLHGECVSIGMLPFASGEAKARLFALLEKIGLPTENPFGAAELLPYLTHDKKTVGRQIVTVQVDAVGQYALLPLSVEEILKKAGGTV